MHSSEDILNLLKTQKRELSRFTVKRIGLFGSAVRNELREDSDLDFLVDLGEETFDHYMDLKFFLESLFHRKVDLVLTDAVKPRLRTRILSEVKYV